MVCIAKVYIYKHLTEHSFCGASRVSLVVKCPPANTGDIRELGSIPRSGWFPGGGHANPLQYSCLKNPMDRGAWRATDHRDATSQTQLKWLSMHARRAISEYKPNLVFTFCCLLMFVCIFLQPIQTVSWQDSGGRKQNRKGRRKLQQYLCSPSSDSFCCEGSAGGGTRSSADGHLLLDPVSPFPSLLCPDLSSTGHRGLSHLSLRGSHVALLLPRGRHFRAWGHGGCLSLPDE